MGASNSHQLTGKLSDGEEDDRIKYGASSAIGRRAAMEDASTAILDLDGSKSTSFFGVYDGHGGAGVALYCAKRFHHELVGHQYYDTNLSIALRDTFFRMDDNLQQSDAWRQVANPVRKRKFMKKLKSALCSSTFWHKEQPYTAPQLEGTTACVVLIRGSQIIVGNVGDSRCVLSRNGQAIPLSTDHKPMYPNERSRIERAGGHVTRNGFEKILPGRVVDTPLGIYRVNGILAVSRTIGDFEFKQDDSLTAEQKMVTCNPDIQVVDITDDTEFLLIASDGFWDVMTNEKAVNFVRDYLRSEESDVSAICDSLLIYCSHSDDNTTVILVQFKNAKLDAPTTKIHPTVPLSTMPREFDPTNIASSSASHAMADADDEITEVSDYEEAHNLLLPLA